MRPCLQTVSHELEEEALQREAEAEKQVKALQAAFAERERKQAEELQAKDQQLAELQVHEITTFIMLTQITVTPTMTRSAVVTMSSTSAACRAPGKCCLWKPTYAIICAFRALLESQ